jgi:hypothetical protein
VKSEGVFLKKTRHLLFFTIFSVMPSGYLPGVTEKNYLKKKKIELMVLKKSNNRGSQQNQAN